MRIVPCNRSNWQVKCRSYLGSILLIPMLFVGDEDSYSATSPGKRIRIHISADRLRRDVEGTCKPIQAIFGGPEELANIQARETRWRARVTGVSPLHCDWAHMYRFWPRIALSMIALSMSYIA